MKYRHKKSVLPIRSGDMLSDSHDEALQNLQQLIVVQLHLLEGTDMHSQTIPCQGYFHLWKNAAKMQHKVNFI